MPPFLAAPSSVSASSLILRQAEEALCQILQRTEDPREQLASLDEEISRVECVLHRLKSMQPTLRRDINRLHSPILNILPTELLAEIFIQCIPTQTDPTNPTTSISGCISPLLLGSVCSSWRQIAWSTPIIWTSPTLLLCKPKLKVQAELLEEWISRSGHLLLSLKLHCASDDDRVTDIPQCLFETILNHASRWKEIDLQVPTAYYQNLSGPSSPFSSLRRLVINPSGGQGDRSHILEWSNRTPQLREISLFSVYLNTVRVQWDNITHIHAKTFYVDECLELIRSAPRLEYCNFYSITRGDDGHIIPAEPIPVPNLHTLALITERSVDSAAILSNIFAPGLATLTHDVAERRLNVPNFKHLVTRSSMNLTRLSILRASISEADLIEILPLIPSVVDFRLNLIEARGVCLDSGVMSMLKPDDDGRCALPNMTHFEYVGPFSFSWPLLVGVLISRRGLNLHPSTSALHTVDTMRDETHLLFSSQSVAILKHAAIRLRESFEEIDSIERHLLQLVRQLAADGLELSIAGATVDLIDFLLTRATHPRATQNTH